MQKRKEYSGRKTLGGRPGYAKKTVQKYTPKRQVPLGMLRLGGNFGRFGRLGEKKFVDVLQPQVATTATGTIHPTATATTTPATAMTAGSYLQIAQGDQEYQRIGKEVTITKLMIRGQITILQDSTLFADVVRVIILQDQQCNGAAPTVNQILNFTGQPVSVNSFNNIENSKRFITICDQTYQINAVANEGTDGKEFTVPFEIFKKVNIPIVYDTSATTGALATIRSNNILGVVISRNAATVINYNMRLRYSDK